MIGMTNLAVLAEGIKVGDKAGMDRNQLLELLSDTGARSFQMDVRGPWDRGRRLCPSFRRGPGIEGRSPRLWKWHAHGIST